MPPLATQETLQLRTLAQPTVQHQGKLFPFAERLRKYHMSNRPYNNQQIVRAQAQPIIHPIIAEFSRKVVEHQRLVQQKKLYTTFQTILAQ
jgi:hypothetical protein